MKSTPLIDSDDPAYFHYKSYNETKLAMKKSKRGAYFKKTILVILVVFLILCGGYIIIYKTEGGDKIDLSDVVDPNFLPKNLEVNNTNLINQDKNLTIKNLTEIKNETVTIIKNETVPSIFNSSN
jgi:hypothetical protein